MYGGNVDALGVHLNDDQLRGKRDRYPPIGLNLPVQLRLIPVGWVRQIHSDETPLDNVNFPDNIKKDIFPPNRLS